MRILIFSRTVVNVTRSDVTRLQRIKLMLYAIHPYGGRFKKKIVHVLNYIYRLTKYITTFVNLDFQNGQLRAISNYLRFLRFTFYE